MKTKLREIADISAVEQSLRDGVDCFGTAMHLLNNCPTLRKLSASAVKAAIDKGRTAVDAFEKIKDGKIEALSKSKNAEAILERVLAALEEGGLIPSTLRRIETGKECPPQPETIRELAKTLI